MAKAIMVQGTCSNAGKSLLAAGLCRIFRQDGLSVAPFKAQNMALNSYITAEGLEMGRAQVMQAEASGIEPEVRMNPILLKPTSERGSQVILNGEVYGDLTAKEYYAIKRNFRCEVQRAYESLSREHDIIVIEGAGSPAEINLMEDDLVNMGMAALAEAPVLLVGDIDRGGVFASLAGTMLLLPAGDRARVKGTVINKFRGDVKILEPGLRMLEDIIHVPVIGVVPYMDIDIDDEDSLTSRFERRRCREPVDIAVIKLPRISNFTDFNALECIEGIGVRYTDRVSELGTPDLIVLPGTKNTMGDLAWLRQTGLEAAIKKYAAAGHPVFGICGGYQMLGTELADPQDVEQGGSMAGMGLLPCRTVFRTEKVRKEGSGILADVGGIFRGLSGLPYSGYEIHMGISAGANIVNSGNVYGSYIHGLFDTAGTAGLVASALMTARGLDASAVKAFDMKKYRQEQYDRLAGELRKALDMDLVYRITEGGTEI